MINNAGKIPVHPGNMDVNPGKIGRYSRKGSPHTPRKASILERKSTTFKSNKVCENSQ
jgi:hypothetical protein